MARDATLLELFEALRTATGKHDARMIIITNAGSPEHFAAGSANTRARTRSGCSTKSRARCHGCREWLEEQRRSVKPESRFRQLHLNEWVEPEDRMVTLEAVLACVTHNGWLPPSRQFAYTLGVDIGLVHDRTAVAVCHLERPPSPSGEIVPSNVVVNGVQVWDNRPGAPADLREVRDWIIATVRTYRAERVILDTYQSVLLKQELWEHGIIAQTVDFNVTLHAELATTLTTLIRNQRLALPRDPALIDKLARVRIREALPGQLRLDQRRAGTTTARSRSHSQRGIC